MKKKIRIIQDFYNLSLSRALGLVSFCLFLGTIVNLLIHNLIVEAAQFAGGLFAGTWGIKLAGNKIKSGDKK